MIDPTLILSVQRGDAKAFASLIDQLRSLVVGLCYAEMGDWDAAEDAAQEVFVRLHTRLVTLQDPKRFAAWLRTVVRHVCFSEKRRQRHTVPLDEIDPAIGAIDGGGSVRRDLDREALRRQLDEVVAELPPTQRRVLVLRHFKELNIETISELTDLTPASVRTMLCRARVSLRRLIEERQPALKDTMK